MKKLMICLCLFAALPLAQAAVNQEYSYMDNNLGTSADTPVNYQAVVANPGNKDANGAASTNLQQIQQEFLKPSRSLHREELVEPPQEVWPSDEIRYNGSKRQWELEVTPLDYNP